MSGTRQSAQPVLLPLCLRAVSECTLLRISPGVPPNAAPEQGSGFNGTHPIGDPNRVCSQVERYRSLLSKEGRKSDSCQTKRPRVLVLAKQDKQSISTGIPTRLCSLP